MLVPSRLNLRLQRNLRWLLSEHMKRKQAVRDALAEEQGIPSVEVTISEAVRMILREALKNPDETVSEAVRAAAFNEGMMMGLARVQEQLRTALNSAVNTSFRGIYGDDP